MFQVAPNLQALIGDLVGARLIAHAGSLTNLAKYPASTVQILGAEKALFRALKTRGKTPKYGLIFHSSFIGKAGAKNKGRVSRYLANKCTIASRIDCFSETPTNLFGKKLHKQVEDRLKFYETGEAPIKNADAMQDALDEFAQLVKDQEKEQDNDAEEQAPEKKEKKKKKTKEAEAEAEPTEDGELNESLKRKSEEMEVDTSVVVAEEEEKPKKKKKKSKSSEAEEPAAVVEAEEAPAVEAVVETEASEKKKKKKKKKSKSEEESGEAEESLIADTTMSDEVEDVNTTR